MCEWVVGSKGQACGVSVVWAVCERRGGGAVRLWRKAFRGFAIVGVRVVAVQRGVADSVME